VAHALGLAWGPAWVLGAAVAPTDATAVGVLARMLPRRILTVLRAESLVNDGTALVIYGLAVGITRGQEHLGALHVLWLFLLAYGGGAAVGTLTAWLAVQARRRLNDPLQGNVAVILTPFTAFLLAEAIHASGVLAVVVCGLIMSQAGPRVSRADTRQQTQAFWSLSTFLLNGALFVLVGLECQSAVRGLTGAALARDDEPALRYDQQYTALRLAVLAHKRATVVRLRDERRIDDIVLRQIQARLDIEEVRLARREAAD
jgi:CPA1 family monovalent cation:H+ antiporter